MSRLLSSPASALAVALSTTFVVVILSSTAYVADLVRNSWLAASPTTATVLLLIAIGFAVVTFVVAGSVLANATATRIADDARQIAMRRLLGSSAVRERRILMRGVAVDAGLGVAVGAVLGSVASWLITGATTSPRTSVPSLLGVFVVALAAAWRGSAAVCAVRPVQALGVAEEERSGRSLPRPLTSGTVGLLLGGMTLLTLGAVAGAFSPFGVLPALIGAILLIVGLMVSAPSLLPRWLRAVHLLLPRSLAGTLAARRLEEHPQRTARTGIGIVVSVAVVTMFVVATASVDLSLRRAYDGTSLSEAAGELLDLVLATVVPLVVMIALVSALGLVDTVLADSRLRARETALLRVLGQARRDVVAEALHGAARQAFGCTVLGVLIGVVVGWVGAQSLLGSVADIRVVAPVLPATYLLAIAGFTSMITLVATIAPLRLRLSEEPIVAFQRG